MSNKRVLNPVERVSEVIFGVLMALAITGSLSVASAGQAEVRTMMLAALGCNIAWGLVDGVMYMIQAVAERTRLANIVARLRATADPGARHALIAEELPAHFGAIPGPEVLEPLHRHLVSLPAGSTSAGLRGDDYLGGLAVFLVVVLSTFPVIAPFVFMSSPSHALRLSEVIVLAMLFGGGWELGRHSGGNPWVSGLALAVIGAALAAAIIALGG